ncbi:MAG: peptide chain release factor 2 [Helicobacteraceae bacterium]
MEAYEYQEGLKKLQITVENVRKIINPGRLQEKIKEIEAQEASENFWADKKKATALQQEKSKCATLAKKYADAEFAVSEAAEFFELLREQNDETGLAELFDGFGALADLILGLEIEVVLSGKFDANNAIVSFTPGAGGTESADWTFMLYRMYQRWAQRKGFAVEILDFQEGDEAGLKDATILIKGVNAYGYLKVESGIHRLVRISPFDANSRRHTSFASVAVSPEIEDEIEINIEEKDLRIDTYRSSGAGGQHVNKTESAIRITHLPTGIVVQCQNDRSQHKNRATAMKMLRSKLYELEEAKKNAEKNGAPKSEIGWGHQIRSYVLAPYRQVKDGRTNEAYSNVDDILDGDLDKIIQAVLVSTSSAGNSSDAD